MTSSQRRSKSTGTWDRVNTERRIPIAYKGVALDCHYRLDLLVNDAVVVEVKAIAEVLPIHQAQVLTYLRLANLPVAS